MKLHNLTIIFIIIILPIVLVLSTYIGYEIKTINKQNMYNTGINTATHDAIFAYEINTKNDSYSNNAENKRSNVKASIKTLENSLSNSCKLGLYNNSEIEEYIPAIVFGMYDGFYMYAPSEIAKENDPNEYEYKHNLRSYVYYSEQLTGAKCDIVIRYTLDSYVAVTGTIRGKYVTKAGYLTDLSKCNNNTYNCDTPNNASDTIKEATLYNNFKYNENEIKDETITYTTLDKENQPFNNQVTVDLAKQYFKESIAFSKWFNKYVLENLSSGEAKTALSIGKNNDPENPNSNFVKHKNGIIKNKIEKTLNSSITAYSKKTGNGYKLPKFDEEEWERVYNNISVITLVQGMNLGFKNYNNYCILNSTNSSEFVNPNLLYFTDGTTYHDIRCEKVKNKETTGYRLGSFEKIKYEITDAQNKVIDSNYYYQHNELACYDCISGKENLSSEKNIYDYINDDSTSSNQKSSYYTSLARERYSTAKLLSSANDIDVQYKTVTYEYESPSGIVRKGEQVKKGTSIKIQKTPNNDDVVKPLGYIVNGWKVKGSKDGDALQEGANYIVTSNVTFVPNITKGRYSITYNDGAKNLQTYYCEKDDSTEVLTAETVGLKTGNGKVFVGWQIQGTDTILNANTSYTPSKDTVLVAVIKYKCVVTYKWTDQNGKLHKEQEDADKDSTLMSVKSKPDNIRITSGGEFVGWKIEGTNTKVEAGYLVTSDITLVPIIENNKYQVTYKWQTDKKGTTETKIEEVDKNNNKLETIKSIPNNLYMEDYCEFDGWQIEGTNTKVEAGYQITSDITLEPIIKRSKCKVTYKWTKDNNGTVDEETKDVDKGSKLGVIKESPSNIYIEENYEFAGWKIQGTDTKIESNYTVLSDIVLEPIINRSKCKVTYRWPKDSKGTMDEETKEVDKGGTLGKLKDKPSNMYLDTKYKFIGWINGATGNEVTKDDIIDSDIILVAKTEKVKCKITYKWQIDNNGNKKEETQEIEIEGAIGTVKEKPDDLYLDENYEFIGWKIEGTETEIKPGYIVKSNITLVPIAKRIECDITYKWPIDNSGTIDTETIKIKKGEQIKKLKGKPDNIYLEGNYEFVGWKIEGTEEEITTEYIVNENIVLVPMTKKNNCKITYKWKDKNGSEQEEVEEVVRDSKLESLKDISDDIYKEGKYQVFKFVGWKNEETEDTVKEGDIIKGDITLIPRIELDEYVLVLYNNYTPDEDENDPDNIFWAYKYYSEDGDTSEDIYYDLLPEPADDARENYSFDGWCRDKVGNDNINDEIGKDELTVADTIDYLIGDTDDDGIIKLYAKWEGYATIVYCIDGQKLDDVENERVKVDELYYPKDVLKDREGYTDKILLGYTYDNEKRVNVGKTMKISRVGEIKLNAIYANKIDITCYNNYNSTDDTIFWQYKYDPSNENTSTKINLSSTQVPIPANDARDGYLFDGWYDNKECKGEPICKDNERMYLIDLIFKQETYDNEINIELYAKWIECATITYCIDGNPVEDIKKENVKIGTNYTPKDIISGREGYRNQILLGYKYDGGKVKYGDSMLIDTKREILLDAIYLENSISIEAELEYSNAGTMNYVNGNYYTNTNSSPIYVTVKPTTTGGEPKLTSSVEKGSNEYEVVYDRENEKKYKISYKYEGRNKVKAEMEISKDGLSRILKRESYIVVDRTPPKIEYVFTNAPFVYAHIRDNSDYRTPHAVFDRNTWPMTSISDKVNNKYVNYRAVLWGILDYSGKIYVYDCAGNYAEKSY